MTGGIDSLLDNKLPVPTSEYRMLLKPEPLSIEAGEAVEVAFALVFGSLPENLGDHADAIEAAYAAAPTAAEDEGPGEQPSEFALGQNYPNPFNPATVIPFSIEEAASVELTISDVLGRRVATLVNERFAAGSHKVSFAGAGLPSGTYFYTLRAGGKVQTKTLFLVK